MLDHIWENRASSTLSALGGASRPVAERFLATLFEERLASHGLKHHTGPPLIPRRLAVAYLADAQLSLLTRWVAGTERCTAEAIAEALVATTNAAASALFRA